MCGCGTGKKDVSAGTGGRRFGRRLCAEVCHAGYECDHRQEKPEEDPVSVLTLAGRNFQEIEEVYNRSQEKFLDLGHLQVVILDESMLTEENRKAFLEYLKQEEHVGEDVYMFRTGMLGEVFHWKGAEESSVGEYLQGIQENRTTGQQKKGVTLREAYHQFYQDGTLPWIPSVWVNGDLLEVDYGSAE